MPATSKTTGFDVTCPFCGDSDALITVSLSDIHTLTCGGCDEEFTPEEARDRAVAIAATLARWEAVVRWVDLADTLAD